MMVYIGLDSRFSFEHLGYLPGFLNDTDPRSAREQLDSHYVHGGGWHPIAKFKLNPATGTIKFPGDPTLIPFAMTTLRDERLYFYQHSLVAIVQPDGAFEVARMD